jgi:hypothetical protein
MARNFDFHPAMTRTTRIRACAGRTSSMDRRMRSVVTGLLGAILLLLGACATQRTPEAPAHRPADVRADIVRLLPSKTADREGWATDIQAAFAALSIEPNRENLCSVLAVAEQESTFTADPAVPGLPKIARGEIDRRAASMHVPSLLVSAALRIDSPNGKSYGDRLAAVRTEKQLSAIFEDFIGSVPLGQRLFAGFNPVRTGGPMQVSVAFAESHAKQHGYPYPVDGTIRREVFSRRGGMYFGIAHLLGYPAHYTQSIHRFADFNAGWYASRNAAFQNAVRLASGIPIALDGDLIAYKAGKAPGATELAVRSLKSLDVSDAAIRRALEKSDRLDFEDTALYERVFALAESIERKPLPRAVMPRITLESPKITRTLTTEWFATRVDERRKRCLARIPGK